MSALTQTFGSMNKRAVQFAAASLALLIVAAIAAPNLLRARLAANQSAERATFRRMYASTRPENLAQTDAAPMSVSSASPVAADLKSRASIAAGATADAGKTAAIDRKLVRTGALELTVKSPAEAAEQIRLMAESMGGYLETAQIGGTRDAPTADITIRVPAARFSDATLGIRKLAARVESEKTEAQDVTRQYVDTEARLHNLRAEEAQYLVIMKSAYKVDDLLEVSEKLSEVRGQIEQQQAEFQMLSKQVETVAITLSLRALADAQVFGLNWRPLYQLKVAARDGLDAIADYAATMTAVVFYVPVTLAWSLTILFAIVVAWRLFRWTSRRFFGVADPKAANSI